MNQQQQVGEEAPSSFPEGFSLPALEIPSKNYSLEADMITGWQPKARVVGPVPLNFDCAVLDELVEWLCGQRAGREQLSYLGMRFASSFKLQQEGRHEYAYKYESLVNAHFPHLAAYFRKFYHHFRPRHARPFRGHNPAPRHHDDPLFDSNFESGNLDAAIRVDANEYDLFMRVDSNTRGHVQWYNFTVRSATPRRIRFHIVNFRKHRTLYSQSLRPYLLSSASPKQGWRQGCENVKYEAKQLRYECLNDRFSQHALTFNCLTFEYFFEADEQLQLAYCPPFTYSDHLRMVASLHAQEASPRVLREEVLAESLGGLELQLLTITDSEVSNEGKKVIVVCGRIHPGETCGSYMVKGLLEFLCSDSEDAKYLRRHNIFKVVPMINIDGVVLGNYRTSLCGRDLNRMFTAEETLLIPEVRAVKNLVNSLKAEFKSRLLFFLDFHGHSVRKNVFIYGPEYDIWEHNYYRTRMLPKIIASRTEIFRYYSCLFRISDWKRSTARAVLLKQIPHCYTVEASIGSYYSTQDRQDVPFTPQKWEFMGKVIAESIAQYFQMLMDEDSQGKKKDRKKETAKTKKLPEIKPNPRTKHEERNESGEEKLNSFEQMERQLFDTAKSQTHSRLSGKAHSMMEEIRQEQEQGRKEGHYSQGGSDSQAASDDLGEKEMTHLHQQIIISIKEFKEKFYNRGKEETAARSRNFLRSSAQMPKRGIEMIASLRKKVENLANTKVQPEGKRTRRVSRDPQWLKSRTQSIPKPQFQPQVQSFQVYVNKIRFLNIGESEHVEQKVKYFSPRKKRELGALDECTPK